MNDSSHPRSIGLLIVAAISATVSVLLAGRMPAALQSFRGMFEALGVKPSAAAKLVMNAPYLWWMLAGASVAVFIWVAAKARLDPVEHRRMKLALRLLIALTVLIYGFAAYALYVPIFKLGAVV